MTTTVEQGATYDITIIEGATFVESFYSVDADGVTVIPFPVGTTGRAQMRAADGTLLLTFAVSVDAVNGVVTLTATDTATSALVSPGNYDLFLDYPDGSADQLVRGTAHFVPSVTA